MLRPPPGPYKHRAPLPEGYSPEWLRREFVNIEQRMPNGAFDGSPETIVITGPAGALNRSIIWETDGSVRWRLRANGNPESGSNAGSDLVLDGFADDGSTVLGQYLFIRRSTGAILALSPSGGIGFGPGAGGTVGQSGSRSTAVAINKVTGQITTDTTSLAAGAFADFVVNNTTVTATDIIAVSIIPGGTGSPVASVVNVATNSFTIRVFNQHASVADTSADKINFAVIRGVTA